MGNAKVETKPIYRTSDLYIAAWLLSKGSQFQNMDRSDVRRSEFTFSDQRHEPDIVRPSICGSVTTNTADCVYCVNIQIK
jgi:hypothetical protein